MIDPRGLRVFLAVCRENSISGGARSLNLSQPSVSNAIAQLERACDATLFERSRTGITLTAEGSALLEKAQAMENLLAAASAQLKQVKAGAKGPLRIGGTPGALVSLLPGAVAKLEESIKQFDLRVVEQPDAALADKLRRREIELAFVTTGLEAPPDDIAEITLSQDPFALIVGPANSALPREVSLKDVVHLPWVLPEARGAFRRQVDALFMAAEVTVPQSAVRCDSLLTTKAIVRSGPRVTVLPMQVAAAELSIGVLRAVSIREARFQRRIGVRMLKGEPLSALAQALIDSFDP